MKSRLIILLGFLLVIVGSLTIVYFKENTFPLATKNSVNAKPSVSIYLKTDATDSQAQSLVAEIKQQKGVVKVFYGSQQYAYNLWKEHNKGNTVLLSVGSPDVFYGFIEVYTSDLSYANSIIQISESKPFVKQVISRIYLTTPSPSK